MKKMLPVLLLITLNTFGQQADFILLKKHNKTITTYYSGGQIAFTANTGAYINAAISGIKNDTLYLRQYVVQYLPTNIGTYIIDTVGSYLYKYHYNQIIAIGKAEQKKFNVSGSAAALVGGGLILTLASGIMYIADRDQFSAPLMYTSMGLAALGYIMAKANKRASAIYIGKKYRLVYMNMSN